MAIASCKNIKWWKSVFTLLSPWWTSFSLPSISLKYYKTKLFPVSILQLSANFSQPDFNLLFTDFCKFLRLPIQTVASGETVPDGPRTRGFCLRCWSEAYFSIHIYTYKHIYIYTHMYMLVKSLLLIAYFYMYVAVKSFKL